MAAGTITRNLAQVRQRIEKAAVKADRNPDSVKLVAVSKTADRDAIQEAYDAGQRRFGENRMQDMVEKSAALPDDIEWHFIGHLQRNKVKPALLTTTLIHSVDSERLLRRIDRIAGELNLIQRILLQSNISGESTKFGASRKQAVNLAEQAVDLKNVFCEGFMTMAPYDAPDEDLETIFSGLWSIRDFMRERHARIMPELSMGMTRDFEAAIACGATYVRIGTAIFNS